MPGPACASQPLGLTVGRTLLLGNGDGLDLSLVVYDLVERPDNAAQWQFNFGISYFFNDQAVPSTDSGVLLDSVNICDDDVASCKAALEIRLLLADSCPMRWIRVKSTVSRLIDVFRLQCSPTI